MSCCGKPRISTAKKLTSLSLTLANVLANAARSGEVLAESPTVEKRLAICGKCRHLAGARCNLCGCFLSVKAALAHAHCPLKLW